MEIKEKVFDAPCSTCIGTGTVQGRPYMDGNSMDYDDDICPECQGVGEEEAVFGERYEWIISDIQSKAAILRAAMQDDGFSESEIKESILEILK